jgi:asparagine synthetase B (glutamine-hydrolysing)
MGQCIIIAETGIELHTGLMQLEDSLQKLPAIYQTGWQIQAVNGAVLAVLSETSQDPVTNPFGWSNGRYLGIGIGELYSSQEWTNTSEKVPGDLKSLCREISHRSLSLEACNGSFLLAYFDTITENLNIVNDRFGLKPLYYSLAEGRFIASTIIQVVIALRSTPSTLDPISFLDLLAYGHLLDEYTLLKEIALLPPGCRLSFANGQKEIVKYWRINFQTNLALNDLEFGSAQFIEQMRDAVNTRCPVDATVAIGLSGGLDSRTVLGSVQEIKDFKTYTWYGHPDSSELTYARELAKLVGSRHKETGFKAVDFVQTIDEFLQVSGGHCDASFWIIWAFGRFLMNDGIEVFLSGAGGDALSGAHHDLWTYLIPNKRLGRTFAFLRAHRNESSGSVIRSFCQTDFFRVYRNKQYSRFEETFTYCETNQNLTFADQWNHFDLRQKQRRRINEAFRNYEQFVNPRYPFYDYRVFDFFLSLPNQWKKRQTLYHRAMCQYMPAIANVPSTSTDGYPVSLRRPDYAEVAMLRSVVRKWTPALMSTIPTEIERSNPFLYWFSGELRDFFRERILDSSLHGTGFIDRSGLERKLAESQDSGRNVGLFLRLLTLQGIIDLLS